MAMLDRSDVYNTVAFLFDVGGVQVVPQATDPSSQPDTRAYLPRGFQLLLHLSQDVLHPSNLQRFESTILR